ncbi:MAG TPA: response regulator [Pyrinomonadaceae bacterium]|nr:response regulator [Pyrinomonadaceae bacterium]
MNDAKKILVVEDDDVTRELMRLALEHRGYAVTTAEDGIAGYDKACALRPDLIVTDIQMPSADGVHMVRRVRDTPEIAETPILVTTGIGFGSAVYTLAQGANAYEPKPIDPASLIKTVEELLAGQARASE